MIKKYTVVTLVILIISIILLLIFNFNNKKLNISEVEKYFGNNETNSTNEILGNKFIKALPKKEKNKIFETNGDISNFYIKKYSKKINNKDGIILFFSKDEREFVLVYEKTFFRYKLLGMVDSFSKVCDISFMQSKKENTDLIFIREMVDNLDNTYEKGTFIKGYYFDGDFVQVVSLTEEYEISSNNIVDRWKKVYEKSDIKYNNEYYPIIEVLELQVDFVSQVTSQKNLPSPDMFDVINTRNIFTKYIWNDTYRHFIIAEGIEVTTGRQVAIVEDLHIESYFEMEELESIKDKYIIKYKDGTLKIVPRDSVKISEELLPLKVIN